MSATSPDTMDGSPARSIVLIRQLHVAGEEGGSATMVAVFLPVLPVGVVLCLSSRDVTRSTYVAVGTKKNPPLVPGTYAAVVRRDEFSLGKRE